MNIKYVLSILLLGVVGAIDCGSTEEWLKLQAFLANNPELDEKYVQAIRENSKSRECIEFEALCDYRSREQDTVRALEEDCKSSARFWRLGKSSECIISDYKKEELKQLNARVDELGKKLTNSETAQEVKKIYKEIRHQCWMHKIYG